MFDENGNLIDENKFINFCEEAGVSEKNIENGITLYNKKVARNLQLKCINFDDETTYKNIIESIREIITPGISKIKQGLNIDISSDFSPYKTSEIIMV